MGGGKYASAHGYRLVPSYSSLSYGSSQCQKQQGCPQHPHAVPTVMRTGREHIGKVTLSFATCPFSALGFDKLVHPATMPLLGEQSHMQTDA
eukprot:1195957-Prorocentrum_minimum.AAC.9